MILISLFYLFFSLSLSHVNFAIDTYVYKTFVCICKMDCDFILFYCLKTHLSLYYIVLYECIL